MQTNFTARVRQNTSLPVTGGLLPLFEAVVNSIQSIEELVDVQGAQIFVRIHRDIVQPELNLLNSGIAAGREALAPITGFTVTDNGVGFNEANMESFETLDSEKKFDKGCRGIGRLLWLKAFSHVHVSSIFKDNNGLLKERTFQFTSSKGITDLKIVDSSIKKTHATIRLEGFEERYRKNTRKTSQAIADSLVEHCLWYFVRDGGAPTITIIDGEIQINLDDVYTNYMLTSSQSDTLSILDQRFELLHIKARANATVTHGIAFCADNRMVLHEKLSGKIPGLHGKLSADGDDFTYTCYVSSSFLNAAVRPERTGFDLPEKDSEENLLLNEITMEKLRTKIAEKAAAHLDKYLQITRIQSRARIESYISAKGPRYRPVLKRIPEAELTVDPNISDKDLELVLHKSLYKIETELVSEGHDILQPGAEDNAEDYTRRVADYMSKAADVKKSDLASYVSHRKVIIDLLEIAIKRDATGNYQREDLIHGMIMPMKCTSNDIFAHQSNLWLIDERLAFHDFLASDKTLKSMPITGDKSTKEPDLCILNVYDNPILVSDSQSPPLASITIVEIKRPMRNDAGPGDVDDPVEQAINYLDKIRQGQATTANGRPIPESASIPGFCYIIADLTPRLKDRCKKHHDMQVTHDKMGFFKYNQNVHSYIEVISFDRLVQSAKERNRSFFAQLGFPTT
ncbi:MAG: ATP-binding protein [Verrucomicrobiota bacterium]